MLNDTFFIFGLKLVSIMLSCVWFSHPLSWEQWIGAVSHDFNPSLTFYQTFLKFSITPFCFLIMFRSWSLVRYMLEASLERLRNLQLQQQKRTDLQAPWTDLPAPWIGLQAPWRMMIIHDWRVLCCIHHVILHKFWSGLAFIFMPLIAYWSQKTRFVLENCWGSRI